MWNDQQIPETYSHYSDIVMETLLQKVKPIMEKESGVKLTETYSYARIYKKGDELKRHKDRYSCEISTTMNLGGDDWPIFLEPSGEEGKKGIEVKLEAGDMLMYRGCELEHWREPFEGKDCGRELPSICETPHRLERAFRFLLRWQAVSDSAQSRRGVPAQPQR